MRTRRRSCPSRGVNDHGRRFLSRGHDEAMRRLMTGFGLDQADLFHSPEERLTEALIRQEHKIAYVDKDWPLDEVRSG